MPMFVDRIKRCIAAEDLTDLPELLEAVGNIDRVLSLDGTALHIAIKQGKASAVEMLLQMGADPNLLTPSNSPPLALAILHELPTDTLSQVLQKTRSVDVADSFGRTALHYAAITANSAITAKLLDANATPSQCDFDGRSALHLAAYSGSNLVVSQLSTNIDLVNLQDRRGRTALHLACENGHADAVETLLRKGADVGLRDANEQTAADAARYNGYQRIAVAVGNSHVRLAALQR